LTYKLYLYVYTCAGVPLAPPFQSIRRSNALPGFISTIGLRLLHSGCATCPNLKLSAIGQRAKVRLLETSVTQISSGPIQAALAIKVCCIVERNAVETVGRGVEDKLTLVENAFAKPIVLVVVDNAKIR